MFFTERVGDVNVLRGGQVTTFNRPADVAPRGEGGMMGIAVDPAFASNRRIYTCYITAAPTCASCAGRSAPTGRRSTTASRW